MNERFMKRLKHFSVIILLDHKALDPVWAGLVNTHVYARRLVGGVRAIIFCIHHTCLFSMVELLSSGRLDAWVAALMFP